MSEKQVVDEYILASDILRNFWMLIPGFRGGFYYTTNPKLEFVVSDGSDTEQDILLRHLEARNMVKVQDEELPADMHPNFISINLKKHRRGRVYHLEVLPDGFNREYKNMEKLWEEYIRSIGTSIINAKDVPQPIPQVDPNTLKVEPSSYDNANHTITLQGIPYQLSRQPNRVKPGKQLQLIKQLFSVKYFQFGVGIRRFYSVKSDKDLVKAKKKARRLVTQINEKLPKVLNGQELIKFDGNKFYIHPQYLKN